MAIRLAAAVFLSGLLGACAGHRETYILVPDAAGNTSPVTVTTAKGRASLTLDQPYSAAAGGGNSIEPIAMDKETVDKQYASLFAAQPPAPKTFILHFQEGDELTAESKAEMEKVFAELAGRPAADIVVVGHTDRVGKLEDNDALSMRRAERIRNELIGRGIAAEHIQAAGRGEREPLVPTGDEIKEPRNRRVEITVR